MNWLGFEGRGFKVKVTTKSDMDNFGTTYFLNGLNGHNQIWSQGQDQCRYKVTYLSELLQQVKASTSILNVEVSSSLIPGFRNEG